MFNISSNAFRIDATEGNLFLFFFKFTGGLTIVIVYGVVLAIQLIVFFIFACKAWDAVFK